MSKEVNSVEKKVKKMKQRLRKLGCCAFWWTLFGILSVVVGIGLLGKFAGHWNDDDDKSKQIAAYIGLVLLLMGLVICVVAVVMCVALYYVYNRSQNAGKMKKFSCPQFAYGEAPYPQQPPLMSQEQPPPQQPAYPAPQPGNPGPGYPDQQSNPGYTAPYPTGPSAFPEPTAPSNVNVQVSDHTKM